MNICEYLARLGIPFEQMQHSPTYGAQKMASVLHVAGEQVAKTVLLRVRREKVDYVVVLLPATRDLDLDRIATTLEVSEVELATTVEMSCRFPDCEIGVVPPFGSEYGMLTIVDISLANSEEIVFEGTSHSDSIRMGYDDFEQLENPLIADIVAENADCLPPRKPR